MKQRLRWMFGTLQVAFKNLCARGADGALETHDNPGGP